MKITTREDLIELLENAENLTLHIERTVNNSAPFEIYEGDTLAARGELSYKLDDDNEFIDELTEALVRECRDSFASVTEYDSLAARTRPAVVYVRLKEYDYATDAESGTVEATSVQAAYAKLRKKINLRLKVEVIAEPKIRN